MNNKTEFLSASPDTRSSLLSNDEGVIGHAANLSSIYPSRPYSVTIYIYIYIYIYTNTHTCIDKFTIFTILINSRATLSPSQIGAWSIPTASWLRYWPTLLSLLPYPYFPMVTPRGLSVFLRIALSRGLTKDLAPCRKQDVARRKKDQNGNCLAGSR